MELFSFVSILRNKSLLEHLGKRVAIENMVLLIDVQQNMNYLTAE